MSTAEQLIKHQMLLGKYSKNIVKILQKSTDRARDSLLSAILINNTRELNTQALATQTESELKEGFSLAIEELLNLSAYEQRFIERLLKKETTQELNQVAREDREKRLLDSAMPIGTAENRRNYKIETALTLLAASQTKLLMQPVRDFQNLGGTITDVANEVSRRSDGILRAQNNSLGYTTTTFTADNTRTTVYKANKQLIKYERWISVLDSETTDFCTRQNGKIYEIGKGPHPPAHHGCRSIREPIIE